MHGNQAVKRVVTIGVAVSVLGWLASEGHLPALDNTGAGTAAAASCSEPLAGFDADQVANASIIANVAHDMGMPDQAIVVALATAMQESNLYNLDYGDRDSLGLFQQRPSQGWGTARQVQDPEYAATKFFRKLREVDGWQDMRITEAAQRVQISAFPEAYQKWADDAKGLARALRQCG